MAWLRRPTFRLAVFSMRMFHSLVFFRAARLERPDLHFQDSWRVSLAHAFHQLPAELQDSEHAGTYAQRFDRRHAAVLLHSGESLAHIEWIARASLRVDELSMHMALDPDERCIYDVMTLPRFRGMGMYAATLQWIRSAYTDAESGERAPRTLRIYADRRNLASISGIRKAGFTSDGSASVLRVAGMTLYRRTRVPGLQIEHAGREVENS